MILGKQADNLHLVLPTNLGDLYRPRGKCLTPLSFGLLDDVVP